MSVVPEKLPQARAVPLKKQRSMKALRFRSSHDVRWDNLDETQAALVREALVRAEELRQDGIDAGDAYLEGFLASLLH